MEGKVVHSNNKGVDDVVTVEILEEDKNPKGSQKADVNNVVGGGCCFTGEALESFCCECVFDDCCGSSLSLCSSFSSSSSSLYFFSRKASALSMWPVDSKGMNGTHVNASPFPFSPPLSLPDLNKEGVMVTSVWVMESNFGCDSCDGDDDGCGEESLQL